MPIVRSKPLEFDLYGLKNLTRIENQSVGPHMVFRFAAQSQIRDELQKTVTKIAIPRGLSGRTQRDIAKAIAPTFLERVLSLKDVTAGSSREQMLTWTRSMLPFGVVWMADRNAISTFWSWEKNTLKEHERNMRRMLPVIGSLPLQDVTPSNCAALLIGAGCSMNEMTRTLRKVIGYETTISNVIKNEWHTYTPPKRRKTTGNSAAAMAQRHLNADMIPNQLLQGMLTNCLGLIESTGDPVWFGVLLALFLPMRLTEICALRVKSIVPLTGSPDTLTVVVDNEVLHKRKTGMLCR